MADSNRITLLFDSYMTDSQNLHNSFIMSNVDCKAVVISDDGFIPDNVISLYQSFLGTFNTAGKPKYFNEIPVPDYWEISGSNTSGEISNMGNVRARIFYAYPTHKRIVRAVEWLDKNDIVRSCDYYNKYGALYARATFDKSQKIILKSYFDKNGREIIVEDYVTNDIILNRNNKVMIFRSKVEFVTYFLEENNLTDTRLFVNSLGTPFFVSNSLGERYESHTRDLLFWQEQRRDDIPGNMKFILEGKAPRIKNIYVQKKNSYDALINLGVPKESVKPLGYVYPFARRSRRRKEALISWITLRY